MITAVLITAFIVLIEIQNNDIVAKKDLCCNPLRHIYALIAITAIKSPTEVSLGCCVKHSDCEGMRNVNRWYLEHEQRQLSLFASCGGQC